jgi:hypothetical protein
MRTSARRPRSAIEALKLGRTVPILEVSYFSERRMTMKLMAWIVGLSLLAFGLTTDAFAWSVAVDAPVSYTLNTANVTQSGGALLSSKDAATVSGYKVAIKLPFFLGVGYEDYKTAFSVSPSQAPNGITNFKLLTSFKIYDLFVELPISVVHIGLGAGIGEAKGDTDPPLGAVFKSAAVTQYFATLGLPIGKMLDVHVGYHVVNVSDMDVATPNGPDTLRLSGSMLSAGIRLGF